MWGWGNPIQEEGWPCPGLSEHGNIIRGVRCCHCSERIVRCCRESIYRLLPQTTPENVSKNFSQYSIDPVTRYPNVNVNFLRPSQVRVPGQSGMPWPLSGPVRACGYEHTQPSLRTK